MADTSDPSCLSLRKIGPSLRNLVAGYSRLACKLRSVRSLFFPFFLLLGQRPIACVSSYYDNLSAKQCHGKSLPCSVNDTSICVTQDEVCFLFIHCLFFEGHNNNSFWS